MAYGTLMVHVALGRPNDKLLQVAGDLAVRFRAGVIGVAARQPARVGAGEGFVFWDYSNSDSDIVRSEFENAEAEFRRALKGRVADLAWRSAAMCASIVDYLAQEMLKADLLIIDIAADVFISNRRVNACDFAMQLGRPVIIVPTAPAGAEGGRAGIGTRGTASESQSANERSAPFDRSPRMSIDQMASGAG